MTRVWFWAPCWYWYGLATLWPIHFGGDEWGRRTLLLGWTVTGRVVVAISRPGQLYRPDGWEWVDPHTGHLLAARIYPYGGGVREHGVQLTVWRSPEAPTPEVVLRIPQEHVRELAELIGASRSLVWHDPRDADDEFWNPQEDR